MGYHASKGAAIMSSSALNSALVTYSTIGVLFWVASVGCGADITEYVAQGLSDQLELIQDISQRLLWTLGWCRKHCCGTPRFAFKQSANNISHTAFFEGGAHGRACWFVPQIFCLSTCAYSSLALQLRHSRYLQRLFQPRTPIFTELVGLF